MCETELFCFSFLMGVEKNLPDGQLEGMLICSRKDATSVPKLQLGLLLI